MADPVVTTLATGSSATATTTVSFTAQAAGTLLELKVGSDDYRTTSGSNRPESTGWALATSGQDFLGAYVWYKLASGSETSVQYTIGSAAASQYELNAMTNIDQTSPLGAVSSLHTHGGANTGTTAITPGAGSRWIVSVFLAGMHSGASSLGPAAALSNSYTIQSTVTGTGSPTEVGMSGYLVLDGGTATSTATVSPGWTLNAPQCSFGLLVAYKVAAAGGTNVTVNGSVATASSAAGTGTVSAVRTALVAGALAAATALALSGSVAASRVVTVAGSVATGSAFAQSGGVAASQVISVAGSVATATATALTGTAAPVRTVTIAGATATANGDALTGSVSTGSTVTVVGSTATATATGPSGTVSASRNITLAGSTATAASAAGSGTATGTRTAAITGATATATAQALNGAVQAGGSTTVNGSTATATAAANPGTVTAVRTVTVAGSASTAASTANPGTVTTTRAITVTGTTATGTATALDGSVRIGGSRPATSGPGLTITSPTRTMTLAASVADGLIITTPATALEVAP